MATHERAPDLGAKVVLRPEFVKRHFAMIEATAKGGAAFKFAVIPHPKGTDLALEDSAGTLILCRTDLRFDFADQPRGWVCDFEVAINFLGACLDRLALSLWKQLSDGEELEPRDVVFLNHWTALRAGPHRLPDAEAERLFGDMPMINLDDNNEPPIDWEGPTRIVGHDPEFQRRKHAAQVMFDHLVMDAKGQFAGATYVAFMQALMKRHDN